MTRIVSAVLTMKVLEKCAPFNSNDITCLTTRGLYKDFKNLVI